MANNETISQSGLRELFSYDSQSGLLVRKKFKGGKRAGPVGTVHSQGYLTVGVLNKVYKVHRLVWLYHHGVFPEDMIDHINGEKADNRIENLRLATASLNKANEKLRRDNTSGFKGAKPHKGKWQARIGINGVRRSLGYFDTPEGAHAAYMKAAVKHFGEFARSA